MASTGHGYKARNRAAIVLLAATAAAAPLICSAANTDTYIGASGTNWNNSNDWSASPYTHLVPAAGDVANIIESPTSLFSVIYDGNYNSATAIGTLTVDGNSSNGVVLNQATTGDNLFAATEYVGYSGIATYSQSAASNSVSGTLYLGNSATGQGTYLLGDTASFNAATTVVGESGNATFTQTGGMAASNNLYLGDGSASSGTYSLSSTGSLTVSGYEFLGNHGTGSFIQSGGTNTNSGWLLVGFNGGGGSYTLSNGLLAPYKLSVGYVGNGTFTQSGGTVTISNYLTVGDQSNGIGSYTLTAGTLSAFGENIPFIGSGTFIQTGGSNAVTGDLAVGGSQAGATGSYSLSATGDVTVGGNAYVGGNSQGTDGSGILTISGGSMSIAGTLKVWSHSGTSVTLSGGTLTLAALDLSGQPAMLKWSGGTLNFTSPTIIDGNFALGASIQLGPPQTLSTSATLTNNGQITLAGGTLGGSGVVLNSAGQIGGYGTIGGTGGFTNAGLLTQSGGPLVLSNTGSNANTGNIDLAVGNQFQLTGGNLANTGTINLNGATVAGTGQLTNYPGGVIAGRGAITAPLANSGTIALTDGTLTLPSFTNNGSVAPGGLTASISGGAINNAQIIEGFGQINNNFTNAAGGLIAPFGGRLVLNGTVTNAAGGLISASGGTQLDVTQGLGTNAGLISLTGGTLNTNSATLANAGTISGYGTLRTGGLVNNAQVTFTGGTATVNGPVTNNSGARIDVKYATAVFNSPVTNSAGGMFKITGGSVAFVGTFTNNGTYASDPSVNYFQDLNVGSSGYLTGGAGDQFHVSGDFTNNSTQTTSWNTSGALLQFEGRTAHAMAVAGAAGQYGWGTIGINAGDTLTIGANSATAAATSNQGALIQNAGTARLGTLGGGGTVSVGNSAGGASAAMIVNSLNQSTVTINATGSLTLAHASSPVINTTSSLSIMPGGKLDLSNTSLLISYGTGPSPLSTIRSELFSGYDVGKWDGTGIVTSVGDANHAIGYVDTANAPPAGQPADTLELELAVPGDTTLKGSVNINDLLTLVRDFGKENADWQQGDFNYDGTVNLADFLILARHFGGGLSPAALASLDPSDRADVQGMLAQVPEPSALAVLMTGAGMLLPRRRRVLVRSS